MQDPFRKDGSPWEGPHSGAEDSDHEEVSEMKHWGLTSAPIPHSPEKPEKTDKDFHFGTDSKQYWKAK